MMQIYINFQHHVSMFSITTCKLVIFVVSKTRLKLLENIVLKGIFSIGSIYES